MADRAAVFPGQGSQYVGMGQALADRFEVVRATFAEADDVLGFSLSKLCFEGPMSELTKTVNTQPALLTASVATFRLLEKAGFRPAACAGHSLGEYSALVAAGALRFEDALRTVRLRGQLMEEAQPAGVGTMGAILGLDDETVQAICREADGVVEPATYNAPGQVVVAGATEAVDAALELAKERGARRTQRLEVSGPFHSSLLEEAGRRLAEWLEELPLSMPRVPVVANVTARPYTSVDEIRQSLAAQVSSPVRWVESVQTMLGLGITSFVEIGPGRVLSGLIKRIDRSAAVANVDSVEGYEELING